MLFRNCERKITKLKEIHQCIDVRNRCAWNASCGVSIKEKLTSSASVCLFSQFKEIKRYILRLNKTLSNDHVLGPTALDLKQLSDSKFKF